MMHFGKLKIRTASVPDYVTVLKRKLAYDWIDNSVVNLDLKTDKLNFLMIVRLHNSDTYSAVDKILSTSWNYKKQFNQWMETTYP